MTWIRTVPVSTDLKLQQALEASRQLYPQEYSQPVHAVSDPASDGVPAILMAHSLIPQALEHAFSTFGALMSPELPLSRRQHELIATTVSQLNDCFY
jgi:alkylhydroperoxidase family enzyme